MEIRNKFSRFMRFSATPLTALWLLAVGIPAPSAQARNYDNNFRLCASELLEAGIAAPVAADACAAALYPRDLTICVVRIDRETNIAAADALETCRQVRRPKDLAKCVVNISNGTQNAVVRDILDNCRLSLLPVRFSECVVGLNKEVDFSAGQVMATCIDASDRPRDLYPRTIVPVRPGNVLPEAIPVPDTLLPSSPIR